MKINYAQAKSICNAQEYALVESCRPTTLAKLSAAEVKRKAGQARKLFDKWNDLAIKQDRERGDAPAKDGERTRLKRDLFREVLDRLEEKAEKVGAKAKAAEEAKSKAANAKKQKAAADKLRALAAKMEEKTGRGISRPKGSKAGKKKGQDGLVGHAEHRGRIADHRKAQSGLTTRTRGHVSARGRRAEAKRGS